jgi:hypothetical protein
MRGDVKRTFHSPGGAAGGGKLQMPRVKAEQLS